MRAIVLDVNPWMAAPVLAVCDWVGMPHTRVDSLPALLRAAETAGRYDVVALDGGCEGSADANRCAAVLDAVACPVFVLHHDESFARLVHTTASRPAHWLPLYRGWLAVLDCLDDAQWGAYAERLHRMRRAPAGMQAAILARLGAGASRAEITRALGLRPGTLKSYLDRLLARYEANTIGELQAIARLALRDGEPARPWYANAAPSSLPMRARLG